MATRPHAPDRRDVPSAAPGPLPRPGGYAHRSTRPLHVLAFLLPMIVAYEIGQIMLLTAPGGLDGQTIKARRMLADAFDWLGVSGLHLPAILAVVVLVVWHVLSGDRWRVRPGVLALMALESIAWTLPLLVLGLMVLRASASLVGGPALGDQGPWALATIAIGAGVYEELLFRMVGMALVHTVARDLLRAGERPSRVAAVVITALAFALYHDVGGASGGGFDFGAYAFYFTAGLYFGVIYLLRGFGIVVAVHALYDIVVLLRPLG